MAAVYRRAPLVEKALACGESPFHPWDSTQATARADRRHGHVYHDRDRLRVSLVNGGPFERAGVPEASTRCYK